jgi:hypothetical protein
MKGNPHFDSASFQFYVRANVHNDAAPARGHWGSNGARAGLDIRRERLGNVDQATPADQFSRAWWRA